jgi:hypothetical protein
MSFKLLECVELIVDLPEEELEAGATGTIVEVLDAEKWDYIVEFLDDEGYTLGVPVVHADQIRLMRAYPDKGT